MRSNDHLEQLLPALLVHARLHVLARRFGVTKNRVQARRPRRARIVRPPPADENGLAPGTNEAWGRRGRMAGPGTAGGWEGPSPPNRAARLQPGPGPIPSSWLTTPRLAGTTRRWAGWSRTVRRPRRRSPP